MLKTDHGPDEEAACMDKVPIEKPPRSSLRDRCSLQYSWRGVLMHDTKMVAPWGRSKLSE